MVKQLGLLLGILGCAYATVSLITYDSRDPGFFTTGSRDVKNAAGPAGAVLADVLLHLVGVGAAGAPITGVVLGLKLAGRAVGAGRIIASVLLGWAALCIAALLSPTPIGAVTFGPGGIVGAETTSALRAVVGPAGSWIAVGGAVLTLTTVVAGVDWERAANRVVSLFEAVLPWLGRTGLRAGRSMVGGVVRSGSAVAGRVGEIARRRPAAGAEEEYDFAFDDTSDPGDLDEDELDEEEVDEDDLDEDDLGDDLGDDEVAEVTPPRPAARPAKALPVSSKRPPAEAADDRTRRTRPAVRELAEVEWEPTSVHDAPPEAPVRLAQPAVNAPLHPPLDVHRPAVSHRPPAAVEPEPEPVVLSPSPEAAEKAAERAASRKRVSAIRGIELTPGVLVSGGQDDGGAVVDRGGKTAFELPHLGLLDEHPRDVAQVNELELRALGDTLEQKLADFGISGSISAIRPGPVITTYEYQPSAGIKLSRITALEDDIAMALKALSVRIVAPIPGKGVVGFEVPNKKRQTVWVRDILSSEQFRKSKTLLPLALGKNVEGRPEIADLAKAPHLLVAGTTGSGKSVGVNAMLLSMLFTRSPEELRLILIDPKMLEFEMYQDIPHLLHPVVTDSKLAAAALKWACTEMDERYRLMSRWKTRNIEGFNERVDHELQDWTPAKARQYAPAEWPEGEPLPRPKKLPYIVIVIDELADLMMVAAKEVEISIARLAQKARAAGLHLIVATQRPEKTVVTGIIKANLPSRIAFQVRSKLDGRIVLDQGGAETLLGKGDMLFLPPSTSDLQRIHGPFVSDEEARRVTDFLRAQGMPDYEADIRVDEEASEDAGMSEDEYDPLYDLAVAYVSQIGKASTSMIQREFKIGYNRAARMIEVMEREGLVGAADGARPREVLHPGGH